MYIFVLTIILFAQLTSFALLAFVNLQYNFNIALYINVPKKKNFYIGSLIKTIVFFLQFYSVLIIRI